MYLIIMEAYEKQIQLSFSVTKLKLVKDRPTYLSFFYSANTGKSLAESIRIRKEKKSPKERNLFQVIGCQYRKLLCERNFKKLISSIIFKSTQSVYTLQI